ncbi:MAG: Eco57I restriction-modification methylase domain-containing protein [Bacteroidales bacterium]|nr:Eco57I restriction-modification methylase domain-containing protein [Bacteroidales bacterium]
MEKFKNINIIENLIVGRVEPNIYAFLTQTIPNYLKVGDTYRPIEKRLDEWRHVFPNLVKVYNETATVDENVYFRDYEVHRFLDEIGRDRLTPNIFPKEPYSKEFFKGATEKDVAEAIEDIRTSYKKGLDKYHYFSDGTPIEFHYNHEDTYEPRPNQTETIKRFKEAIMHGRKNLLMYAVMRFGKSFTAMCCAVEMSAKFVVVVSGKADVKSEWKKTVEGHKKFIDYKFFTSNDLLRDDDILSTTLRKKRVVLFLTLQDLTGNEIKKKHKDVFKNTIDLLLVDETHFGARAKEYGKVLVNSNVFEKESDVKNELSKADESLDDLNAEVKEFNAKVRIHLSGTPYRILMGSEFSKNDIIAFYQFSDIVKDQEKYDNEHKNEDDYNEWDNPYYGFPQMVRFAFNPSESARLKLEQMKKRGVTYAFSALFKTRSISKTKDKQHCYFEHEEEILDLFKVIDGTKDDSNVLGFLNYSKIKKGKLCRHIVCVLPYCAACDALEKLIHDNAKVFQNLNEYQIINISGWENSMYHTTESVQEKILELENQGIKTITLTVNKMLTGSTVPQWDTMIFLKDTASPQEYDQAIFRLQNQYVKVLQDEKGNIIKHNMKPQTLLVDFDPNRMFVIQEEKSKIYNVNTESNGNDNLQQRITDDLRISPIITINNGKIQEITPINIMDVVRKYSCTKSVIDEASDINTDYSLLNDNDLKNEINGLVPIDTKKGIEIKAVEEEGGDYDIPDDWDSKCGETSNNASSDTTSVYNESEENDWKKKIITLYALVLFYSFLTDSNVKSLEDVIYSIKNDETNKRIAKHVGIKFQILVKLRQKINPFILSNLDYKIQNINTLLRDESMTPIERAKVAVNKFGRLSDSEIVTPEVFADTVVSEIDFNVNSGKILDIASKQAEFAYSIFKKLGESSSNRIYSIPTSPLAYEFTLKVYKLLNLNTDNIFADFNSYDLVYSENKETIIDNLKNMNFGYVVGNPPYQDQGGAGGNNDAPIYQEFCDIADKVTHYISSLVIKAGWFSVGRDNLLGAFRTSMLTSGQVRRLVVYTNSSEIFSNVEIKGGICYYIKDKTYKRKVCEYTIFKDGKKESVSRELNDFDILIREPMLNSIVKDVHGKYSVGTFVGVDTMISSDTPFGIPSNPRSSKKNPFVVYETPDESHDVLLFHIEKLQRKIGYCSKSQIKKNVGDIKYNKVFIPCSGGSGDDKKVLGYPELAPVNSVCSQSYLYAKFDTPYEAANFISYMKTKFFRILVSAIKITQACPQKAYRFVPKQDFSKPWTDEELYAKYNLSDEQIEYIESKLDEMK